MAQTREEKEARRIWEEHCKRVQALTALSVTAHRETKIEKEKRIKKLLADYPRFCEYYFPHYMRRVDPETGEDKGLVSNAKFHNEAHRDILKNKTLKAVFMWPRGHAKSTHLGIFIPINLMMREVQEIRCGIVVNKSEDGAKTLLGDLQAESRPSMPATSASSPTSEHRKMQATGREASSRRREAQSGLRSVAGSRLAG